MNENTIFAGMNGFVWWTGVVENRNDPLNLCRCQIRIYGWHTENKTLIPTKDLPWAQPLLPVNTSNESKTPLEGDWVVGFFYDGSSGQVPVYFGVMPGIPVPYIENPQKGFCDPRTDAQLASSPNPFGGSATRYPRYIGEPTTSRLYRNEDIESTIIGRRNASLTKGVQTAVGSSWSEPASPYNAVPPYNDVKETESGHVIEFDDTPNAERVNLAHRTGTYVEMRPDGSKVTKVLGKNYEIIAGDDFVNVQGTCNITVSGNVNLKASKVTAVASSFNLTGGVNVIGDVSVTGKITATGDVVGGGISLDNHIHSDPQGGTTGPPQ
jgi:phage baseplate assembly protein gpV